MTSTGEKADGNVDQREKRSLANRSVSTTHEVCNMLVISFELLQNITGGNSIAGYNSSKFLPGIYSFDFISELTSENKETLLDFKLPQCCECILSSGRFPSV
jgi:hypothetical protein